MLRESRRRLRCRAGAAFLVPLLFAAGGCASFAPVQSAQVTPGTRIDVGASLTSAPGEEAGWFWSLDCGASCDTPVFFPHLGMRLGRTPEDGSRPYEVGFGISGVMPYADGYIQMGDAPYPYGFGLRVGTLGHLLDVTFTGRLDVPLATGGRLVLNSSLYGLFGNSPNGANPGSFLAFVQGVGIQPAPGVMLSVSAVAGTTHRESYGRETSGGTVFAIVGVTFPVWLKRP